MSDKVTTSIRLPKHLLKWAQAHAARRGQTFSGLVGVALQEIKRKAGK